jgi:hypothetical protein
VFSVLSTGRVAASSAENHCCPFASHRRALPVDASAPYDQAAPINLSERRSEGRAMKLMWFHLMPYTELPDDFREKHPSVWVDIHSSLFDPRRAHHMYNDFMDELEFAAECGFDAICVNEHHSNGYGLMPSPNLIASATLWRSTTRRPGSPKNSR